MDTRMTDPETSPDLPLLLRRDGAVVWLTLNRKRAMNALDGQLLELLDDSLQSFDDDDTVGALVLTGAGHRAFCFGADMSALDAPSAAERRARFETLLPLFQGVIRRLAGSPVAVIAALNGFATGAGLDLALACDLRVATSRAKLGSAFVGLGLVPDGGGTYHLPQLVGTARALELILGAEPIDALTALEIGLVNRVVEPDQLATVAGELAHRLAGQPRAAVGLARRLVRQAAGVSLDEALAAEARAQLRCAESAEFEEAIARFRRRR
jgi:enoyl-CoA hydratase/carnithine racemase